MARAERRDARQWIVIITLIVALLASNIGWMIYESQFETYTYSQDGESLNNINSGEQGMEGLAAVNRRAYNSIIEQLRELAKS